MWRLTTTGTRACVYIDAERCTVGGRYRGQVSGVSQAILVFVADDMTAFPTHDGYLAVHQTPLTPMCSDQSNLFCLHFELSRCFFVLSPLAYRQFEQIAVSDLRRRLFVLVGRYAGVARHPPIRGYSCVLFLRRFVLCGLALLAFVCSHGSTTPFNDSQTHTGISCIRNPF